MKPVTITLLLLVALFVFVFRLIPDLAAFHYYDHKQCKLPSLSDDHYVLPSSLIDPRDKYFRYDLHRIRKSLNRTC